jgi:sortase A
MPIAAQQDIVASEPMTSDRAGNEIRNELLEKVLAQSSRARKSRHFVPLVSAFAVMSAFVFLQFNQVLFAQVHAFVSPGEIDAQNIIIDPYSSTKVSQDPKIIIPKINVEAPVVYGVTSLEDAPVQKALHDGVVHYPIPGANSVPGQSGTSVVLGHSSSDVFDNGGYKFVFVQLDRLEKGDLFYMNYLGTRYTYSVTDKLIIEPNEVGKLVRQGTVPMAALVTCTPTGTALRRLVVFADQISPSPEGAQAAPEASSSAGDAVIPGNTPSLLQRLFGGQ